MNPLQLSAATTDPATPEPAAGPLDPVGPRRGRSGGMAGRRRGGNPLGNPGLNLALRCGARARSGCACRAPRAGDGERAVPDAWRAQHWASDAGGETEPDRRAHHAWAPRGAAAEGAAGDPDGDQADVAVRRRGAAWAIHVSGNDGGVGAVSPRVPAAREPVERGGFGECATNPLHLSAAGAPRVSRPDGRGGGFGTERPGGRAGGGDCGGGVAGAVAGGDRICPGSKAGCAGREAGRTRGQAGGMGGEAGSRGGDVDRAGTGEKWRNQRGASEPHTTVSHRGSCRRSVLRYRRPFGSIMGRSN